MSERIFTPEVSRDIDGALSMSLGEIVAVFTVDKLPQGGAPEEIRQKWIGLSLPIREALIDELGERRVLFDQGSQMYVVNNSRVPIAIMDAVLVLDETDPDAAAWWMRSGYVRGDIDDTFGFRADEGVVKPVEGPSKWSSGDENIEPEF